MNLDVISPNGEGFVWCCLVGGAAGERVIGIHLLRLGERCEGLCNGSNSKVRFSVAPQAILNSQKYPPRPHKSRLKGYCLVNNYPIRRF